MLTDVFRQAKLNIYHSRWQDPPTERDAIITLAVVAWLSFLVYVLVLADPFGLLAYYRYQQLTLHGFPYVAPLVRWEVIGTILLEGLLYWAGWRAARNARSRCAWLIVIWGGVASALALLCLYPIASTDIFDYIVHGRMVGVYGANPFTQTGYAFPRDPFVPYMGWPGATSAYGPVWEIMAGIVARLAGNGITANVLAFKLLSGLFLAGSAGLVAAILRKSPPYSIKGWTIQAAGRSHDGLVSQPPNRQHPGGMNAMAGVLLLSWNPIVLFETFGDGHNDIVMVFWLLAAVWLLVRRRYTLTILALLVGALIKFIPLLLVPAAGLVALRNLSGRRARIRFLAITGLTGLALVVGAYAPFWQGPAILSIARRGHLFTTSLPAVFYNWLMPIWGADKAGSVISKSAWTLTVLFALWQGVHAWQNPHWRGFVLSAFYTLMFYLMVTVLWFMPWYSLWPLGLAPMLPSGRYVRLAQVFAFAAVLQPIVVAPWLLWGSPLPVVWQQLGLTSSTYYLPWAYMLFLRPAVRYR